MALQLEVVHPVDERASIIDRLIVDCIRVAAKVRRLAVLLIWTILVFVVVDWVPLAVDLLLARKLRQQ